MNIFGHNVQQHPPFEKRLIFEVVKSITADLSPIPSAFKKVKEMKRNFGGRSKRLYPTLYFTLVICV